MALTLKQIADQAGVSPMTVSRTLRGSGRVKPQTREKILAIANREGYARGGRKGPIVAMPGAGADDIQYLRLMLVRNLGEKARDEGYTAQIEAGLSETLANSGGRLTHVEAHTLEEIQQAARENQAQGLVVRSLIPERWIRALIREFPVVYAVSFDHQLGVDSVYTNEHRSASQIYERLVGYGHRDIAWAGVVDDHRPEGTAFFEPGESGSLMDRISSSIHGVRHAAWANITHCQPTERQQPLVLVQRDWRRQSLAQVVETMVDRLMALTPRPTAVVVSSHCVAIELMRCMERRGLRVPEDFSVVAYGQSAEGREVGLAVVSLPMTHIAKAIPELVRRRMMDATAPAISMQFETELMEGRTLGVCGSHEASAECLAASKSPGVTQDKPRARNRK